MARQKAATRGTSEAMCVWKQYVLNNGGPPATEARPLPVAELALRIGRSEPSM